MAGGGGNDNLVGYLPVAAALAATVMTDGAAAPMLGEALGAEAGSTAATVLGAGAMGALTGGATSALRGGNILQGAAIGGIGGAAMGGIGSAFSSPGTTPPSPDALTGANVSGNAALGTGPGANLTQIGGQPVTQPIIDQSALSEDMSFGPNANTYTPGTEYQPAPNAPNLENPGSAPYTPTPTPSGGIPSALKYGAAALGIGALMQADNKKYGVPSAASQKYSGPLTKFKYDPNQYQPTIAAPPNPAYQPQYANYAAQPYMAAEGGIVPTYADGGLLQGGPVNTDYMGGDMYPQSQQDTSHYATPSQMPTSAQQTMASYEPKTNPLTGEPTAHMAAGGIASYSGTKGSAVKGSSDMAAIDDYMSQYQSDPATVMGKAKSGDWNAMIALNKINNTPNQNYAAGGTTLGGYSDGGRMLKGPGDGMSDNIPATIGGKQPARLADGEFVVPADVVSHLGNGSTDAGAKRLYSMMDKVRKARTGTKKQGKQIKAEKYLPK